jgi:hypothetical protein
VGYYITFVFDPSKDEFDKGKLIARFLEAGAWEEASWFGKGKDVFYDYHLLSFGTDKPEWLKKGHYADARFSWGAEPDLLVLDLTGLLDLADRIGCRLYDGQLDIWITRENLNDIADGFARSARSIGALFGAVDAGKYMAAAEEILKEKTAEEMEGK